MIGLYFVGLAVVGLPLAALAYALLRGVRVRVDVDVRPVGDATPPPPPPRSRTQTRAAPRAQGIPRNGPSHADTWDGTTPAPRSGASGDATP